MDAGKVLIIDHEDDHRFELKNVLRSEGFQIADLRTDDEGVPVLDEFHPGLVIVNLPDGAARKVCAAIKARSDTFIPILQLSPRAGSDLRFNRNDETMADSCLIHPIEPMVLLATVHSLLRLKRTSDSLKEAEIESRDARELAERANEAKTQFLANLSHEIRTPISAILGFSDLLLSSSDERSRKDLGRRIRSNGNQLLRLIDDVLNLSKFEVGKIPIRKEAFSVTEMVYEVLKVSIPEADAKGVRIHSQFALNGMSIIYSDPVRFRQIITNLVTNAVKFSAEGKVDVRVLNQGMLVIEVEDHGIGMNEEEQKRIFQPFAQADASISTRFGGSGLGLALAKKISQALGGDLELKSSAPGRGSCFRVTIDPGQVLDRVAENESLPIERSASKQLQGIRVLLVDDSSDNEELIRFYLQHDGAKVEVAHNGYEALSKVENHPFDIVLMDVQMPEMDGLEATRRLRAQGYQIPIIALTAHALREEVNRSLDAGCDAHITKPITRKELVARIRGQLIERSVWMNAPKHIM